MHILLAYIDLRIVYHKLRIMVDLCLRFECLWYIARRGANLQLGRLPMHRAVHSSLWLFVVGPCDVLEGRKKSLRFWKLSTMFSMNSVHFFYRLQQHVRIMINICIFCLNFIPQNEVNKHRSIWE